jgi:site-specific DNA recombinase
VSLDTDWVSDYHHAMWVSADTDNPIPHGETRGMTMIIDPYIRVSMEEQATDGVSLDVQRARIVSYHGLYGRGDHPFELGEWHVDGGVSGKTLRRPGIQAAIRRMDRGESDGIIVAKLDRLTRSLRDISYLIDDYFGEEHAKRLVAVDNQVNTMTANGRMMINLIVMLAQWERETISERTRDALRHKIARGERCGKVRYGHRLNADGKTLSADAKEQEGIALMRRLQAEGRSLRMIGRCLERAGFPSREGGPWAPTSLAKILKRTA